MNGSEDHIHPHGHDLFVMGSCLCIESWQSVRSVVKLAPVGPGCIVLGGLRSTNQFSIVHSSTPWQRCETQVHFNDVVAPPAAEHGSGTDSWAACLVVVIWAIFGRHTFINIVTAIHSSTS
jgi:hypothetical protein